MPYFGRNLSGGIGYDDCCCRRSWPSRQTLRRNSASRFRLALTASTYLFSSIHAVIGIVAIATAIIHRRVVIRGKRIRRVPVSLRPWVGVEGDLAVGLADRHAPPPARMAGGEQLPGPGDFLDVVAAGRRVAEGLDDLLRAVGCRAVIEPAGDPEHSWEGLLGSASDSPTQWMLLDVFGPRSGFTDSNRSWLELDRSSYCTSTIYQPWRR
jgi:hypothetical protein